MMHVNIYTEKVGALLFLIQNLPQLQATSKENSFFVKVYFLFYGGLRVYCMCDLQLIVSSMPFLKLTPRDPYCKKSKATKALMIYFPPCCERL